MSKQDALKFCELVSSDPGFSQEVGDAQQAALIKVAEQRGLSFTPDELRDASAQSNFSRLPQDLADESLDGVAAGGVYFWEKPSTPPGNPYNLTAC